MIEAAFERGLRDGQTIVIPRADGLDRQQRAWHLIEMTLVRGSVQRRIALRVSRIH